MGRFGRAWQPLISLITSFQVQNFNIGQRSPLFDKFQPKCALASAAAARLLTDTFFRYKELAGLSVMRPRPYTFLHCRSCFSTSLASPPIPCSVSSRSRTGAWTSSHRTPTASLCSCWYARATLAPKRVRAFNTWWPEYLQVVCRLGKLPLPAHPFSNIIHDASAAPAKSP